VVNKKYLTNKIANLLWFSKATASGIANGPTRLFFCFKFTVLKQMNERRNKICVNNRLDLIGISGGDVGYCPARFLSNCLFQTGKKTQQRRKGTTVDNNLSLYIIPSDDVAD